ncbi:hypothetical protein HIM_08338 [Hirsutella minnesotensis 3608]|uniref:Methyltransferase domain-containing protein n=1 Tax=Hirsutella minnesotensis 3608 TaxID=1043627 RepID=A0A0F7ZYD8_9HYPO|nr:hypothetical protein HIM_08338 [Hirsutella minnesotensis 3608]
MLVVLFREKPQPREPLRLSPEYLPIHLPSERHALDQGATPMTVDRLSVAFRLALPEPTQNYEQDAEWCVIDDGSGWRELRFHNYRDIFRVPGLYEKLFHEILMCRSPPVVCHLLVEQLIRDKVDCSKMRVLDVGAGNGMVAEELRKRGIGKVVGLDIIDEAAEAAQRDRPGVYDDYLVVDLTKLGVEEAAEIVSDGFHALITVGALGFGDIPPEAFQVALDMICNDGLIAFTIRDDFLSENETSGFAALIRTLITAGGLKELRQVTYQHRLATTRQPVHYRAIVARKG